MFGFSIACFLPVLTSVARCNLFLSVRADLLTKVSLIKQYHSSMRTTIRAMSVLLIFYEIFCLIMVILILV